MKQLIYGTNDVGRATKGAGIVNSLLAKLYLRAHDWQSGNATQQVIDLNQYHLLTSYLWIVLKKESNKWCSENIFSH